MGVKFFYKKQLILAISSTGFYDLHKRMVDIIERKPTEWGENIKMFLKRTDQEVYGYGLVSSDVEEYLKTKKDAIQFAALVKQAIGEEQTSEYPYHAPAYERLMNFHRELLKYAETLKE